jgi:hypothetical protein
MVTGQRVEDQMSATTIAGQNINLDLLIERLEEKGFKVKQNKDSGADPIDIACKITVHSS